MGVKESHILIVDSNKSYQESIAEFLKEKVTQIDVLDNWKEATKYLDETLPNILIGDINEEGIDVINLLKRIKENNHNIQIILSSAHFEVKNLLEAIHIGIADFIPKPLDFTLLEDAVNKALVNIEHLAIPQSAGEEKNSESIYDKLQYLVDQNSKFEFTNYYKGVPISRLGTIKAVNQDNIEAVLDQVQFQALLFEKYAVLEEKASQQVFIAKLVSFDQKQKMVRLKDLKHMQYSPKRRVDVRVSPDDDFKLVVVKDNIPYRVKVHDISMKSLAFDFDSGKERFKIDDEVILNIAIYRKDNIQKKYKSVLKLTTKVYRILPKANATNIVVTFSLHDADEESLGKYIYQRELDIVSEFRDLVRKSLINNR